MDGFYNFLKDLNINNKNIVAAISGGPDSMCLLDNLIKFKHNFNYNIIVVHVHHNLRDESDYEALKVEEYCKNNNVIFELRKIEKYPNNKFSEESARKIRYSIFDEIIKKYNSEVLFTAHHGDDLIETVLMRITRGSSVKGYAGFQNVSYDRGYKIARPLINSTKQEIEKYCSENNIWCANDLSNKNDKYTRNRYRKYILPKLKLENPNVHFKFIEFSKKLLMMDRYIKEIAKNVYNDILDDNKLNIMKFNIEDIVIRRYILEEYLNKIYKEDIVKIDDRHVDLIINYLKDNNNTVFDLPLGKKGIIEYNEFQIKEVKNSIKKIDDTTFYDCIELDNGKKIKINNNTNNTSNFVIHLNSNDIKLPFHVRSRKNGDWMIVKNMLGKKKVNDIFTDSKVLKELRDTYPIVTDDTGEIIWIPGIKKSHLDRKKEQNYDIILEYS